MIATRIKTLAVSFFIVCAVTAGMVIGASQITPPKAEAVPPSQAAATTVEAKTAPAAQQVPSPEVARTKASPVTATAEKAAGNAAAAVPAADGAPPPGRTMRMTMMEGGFGGGDAGGGESGVEFRQRLEFTQLAAALPTWEKNPKNDVILKKLETPIPMNFANETPLEDVLKYIKTTLAKHDHPLPIYVDPLGLQQAERSINSTIQIDLEGVPLKTTLRLVLKQLGLAYCVRDGVLIISSVQGIREELAEAARELLGAGNENVDLRLLVPMGIVPRGMMGGSMGGMGQGMGGMGGGMRGGMGGMM